MRSQISAESAVRLFNIPQNAEAVDRVTNRLSGCDNRAIGCHFNHYTVNREPKVEYR